MKARSMFLLLPIVVLISTLLFGADVPVLSGRITDNAQILSPEVNRSLSDSLQAHEKRTGNQIAVLTIPSLDGESIEDYAVRVLKSWKLGQKGKDNSVLIVVVPNDRLIRIEVGSGLEGTLTDAMAGRIIQTAMTPKFKNGDFDGGITDGVKAAMELLFSGSKWTEETARANAFQNITYKIDVSQYPQVDPDYEDNMQALKNGRKMVGNRFISLNPVPPIAYVVSPINDKGNQEKTMFYREDGHLLSIRLFSAPDYPRIATFYCVDEQCREVNKCYSRGELSGVSFHVTMGETFFFHPSGECVAHVKLP